MLSKYLSLYSKKHSGSVILLLLGGILLTACHRDLTDPFIPKDKKFNTQFKFDVKRNRTVEKHVSFAREKGKFKDTFAGSRGRGRNGGRSKDSFASRSKSNSGGSRFSKSKGRVVEKGFMPSKRNNESFSSKAGGSKSNNRFSPNKNKVVSYKKKGSRQWSGKESYGGKQNSGQGMYRFDKKSKRIVSRGKFTLFSSKKHSSEMGSYAGKKRNSGGMYVFNAKKKQVTRTNAAFSGFRRFRTGDSFGGKRNSAGGEFSFNSKKKRVSKRVSLFKPRDTDPGSFGSRFGKSNSGSKQHVFSNKRKRIHHRSGTFWDLFRGGNRVTKKKKEPQLDLFDPKMKNQMPLGR